MDQVINEIEINGVKYVKKGSEQKTASLDGVPYQIVRTYSAGVFAGYIEKRDGMEAVVRNARRLWHWEGAASLSELAMRGTSKPDQCQFPCAVDRVVLTQVIEILDVTEAAKATIDAVKVWTK